MATHPMLRIVTQLAEAQQELARIRSRHHDDQVVHKEATVRAIIQTVRRQGDSALMQYTAEYDCQSLSIEQLRVSGSDLDVAYQQVSPELLRAMQVAADQITAFHQLHRPKSWVHFAPDDVALGRQYRPVDRVGLYVPRGRMGYPSTVLMNAIPARVAGVGRLVMVTPPNADGSVPPAVLVAAQVAGINEIYRVGGAQAIAALAYGTETIPKVDLIAGPGNMYVTLAKQLVCGSVGIDAFTSSPELVIIADAQARAGIVAADLLAQAERDVLAAAILITTDLDLAEQVKLIVEQQLTDRPYPLLTEKAIAHHGLIVVTEKISQALDLANEFAPAQVMLWVAEPWEVASQLRHAGAILMGGHTPTAVNSYIAGPNSNLPTSGAASFSSGLGVETFMKYSNLIEYSPAALSKLELAMNALAQAEGLIADLETVERRVED